MRKRNVGECCVCLEPVMLPKHEIGPCPAGHAIHVECAAQWENASGHATCPVCRKDMTSMIEWQDIRDVLFPVLHRSIGIDEWVRNTFLFQHPIMLNMIEALAGHVN